MSPLRRASSFWVFAGLETPSFLAAHGLTTLRPPARRKEPPCGVDRPGFHTVTADLRTADPFHRVCRALAPEVQLVLFRCEPCSSRRIAATVDATRNLPFTAMLRRDVLTPSFSPRPCDPETMPAERQSCAPFENLQVDIGERRTQRASSDNGSAYPRETNIGARSSGDVESPRTAQALGWMSSLLCQSAY